MSLDHVAQRAVERHGLERVERVADAVQQPQVLPQLVEGRERPHVRLRDELVSVLEQLRNGLLVQGACERVGLACFFRRFEGDAVPGRVVRSDAELTEARRERERARGVVPAIRESFERRGSDARGRAGRYRQRGQPCQLARDVEDGDAEVVPRLGERVAVVAQHGAEAHERVVDVGHLRLRGLLVACDGADQVGSQRLWCDGETVEVDPPEAVGDALERRPARTDDEHPSTGAHLLADRVDDGLRAAGAGQRVHGERLPCRDPRQHRLLLRVGVEQERV